MREVPYSVDYEQNVLGGLLLNPAMFDETADLIGEGDFFRTDHRAIFAAMRELYAARTPLDYVTLADYFRTRGKLDDVGGVRYLSSLQNDTPSAANVAAYARGVRDYALRRQVIAAGGDIAQIGYAPGERSAAEVLDEAQRLVMGLGERADDSGPEPIGLLAEKFHQAFEARENSGRFGLETGLIALDNHLQGLQPGDLLVIAGRPSMGKTAIALGIAEWVSRTDPALVFSMEMSKEQITARTISLSCGLPLSMLKSPTGLSDRDRGLVTEAVKSMKSRQLIVDDRSSLTVLQLSAKARRVHRRKRLSLVVVDYLQLMSGSGGNRNEEVNEISRGLKCLARDLECPVIALSQLNRGCENRDNKRPRLSDLRDSGSIEQDADIVIGMYRDAYYNPPPQPGPEVAEAIVLKHRNGPVGTVELEWVGTHCLYTNYTGPSRQEREPAQKQPRGFEKLRAVAPYWSAT